MRHRKAGRKLDRNSATRKGLLRDLATSLIIYEKIKTTEAKAKALRPVAERLVTVAKKNTITSRRRLLKTLRHKKAVDKALDVIGPRYATRAGGYLRITRIGNRLGDGAAVCQIEFV